MAKSTDYQELQELRNQGINVDDLIEQMRDEGMDTEIEAGPRQRVEIFDQSVLDLDASNAQGKRVYKNAVYIKVQNTGYTDYISRALTPDDIKAYPAAYKRYLQTRENAKKPGWKPLSVLPCYSPAMQMEFEQIGIHTVYELATVDPATLSNTPAVFPIARKQAIAYVKLCELETEENANG